VGPNPTFGEHALKVEVHVLDFDEALYGQPLEVEFLQRLRDIQSFASAEELAGQLRLDVELARRAAGVGDDPGRHVAKP
jgi:riboflavin kinase/FMN adenylyltransferase